MKRVGTVLSFIGIVALMALATGCATTKQTENMLAQLEFEYRNRPAKQIRRTYFAVEPDGKKYKFSVFRQIAYQ